MAYGIRNLQADRELTLAQATRRHAMVGKAVMVASKAGSGWGNAGRDVGAVSRVQSLEAIWQALVGAGETESTDVAAQAIALTMPTTAVPLMRRADSLPAAFAFVSVVNALDHVDLDNDLAVRDAIRSAWAEFDQRRRDANNVEEGFGCDDSQSWHTLRDVLDKNDTELTDRMMRIAKLAGRMFDAMSYAKKRVESDDPQEVKSATIGGDVARLLPSELAKIGNSVTRDQTTMRVLKKQAQVFQMKGVRTKSRGPMVVAIDESGSMHDSPGQDGRNTWAKAAAVALTRIAWSENRPVRVVHFGTATVTQDVPRDDADAMWQMARSFLSGGTDFQAALSTARAEVGDLDKAGYKGADIVMITDGAENEYAAHNREINQMDADGIKLWTVTIGYPVEEKAPIRARAELYIHARDVDLRNPDLATDMASQLKGAALAKPNPNHLN